MREEEEEEEVMVVDEEERRRRRVCVREMCVCVHPGLYLTSLLPCPLLRERDEETKFQ